MRTSHVLAAVGAALICVAPTARAQTPETGGALWPEAGVHVQFPGQFRLLGFGQLKQGTDYTSQQWTLGLGLAYQWMRILGDHEQSVDPDREHHLVLGAGYEYLQTTEPTPEKFENRLGIAATFRFRPLGDLLVADRNRYEYRWVDGDYSTRYRNRVTLEYDLPPKTLRFKPFAAAEWFYDVTKGTWNEEQYSAGILWPLPDKLLLQAYYLRQNCPSCSPANLNVLGVTVDLYLGVAGK